MNVLLADDDAVSRALIGAALVSLGHDPVLASDGEEAWQLFESAHAPLAVLDIETPKLDGIALCRRIRASDVGREVFILVLTSRDTPDALAAALDAGADDYVTRPASPENIRARLFIAERRIRQLVARSAAEGELARSRWLAGIGETTIALQHEINNPLTALLGHAELLMMDYKDRDEPTEHIEIIFDEARRIAGVVKRLGKLKDQESMEHAGAATMIDLKGPAGASHERIPVRYEGGIQLVPADDVDYIEAAGDTVRVHVGRSIHRVHKSMGEILSLLDPARFVRIHNSTIVNLGRVRELRPFVHGEKLVVMQDGTTLKLSRGYRDAVLGLLGMQRR